MFEKVVAISEAGRLCKGSSESIAQLEGITALIYTDMKKPTPNDHYNIEQVVTDWFEAVWEVTPYEAHEYAVDLIECVFNVLFVDPDL